MIVHLSMRSNKWILNDVSIDLGIKRVVGHPLLHLVHPRQQTAGPETREFSKKVILIRSLPVVDALTLLGNVVDDVLGMVTDVLQLADDVAQDNDAGVGRGVPKAVPGGVLVIGMTL